MNRRRVFRILAVMGSILILALTGFVIWAGTPAGVLLAEFAGALDTDTRVTVSSEPWLTFTPEEEPSDGFIFYPGGRVLPEAYAPAMRKIAEAGHTSLKLQIHCADGSMTLFADDHFSPSADQLHLFHPFLELSRAL